MRWWISYILFYFVFDRIHIVHTNNKKKRYFGLVPLYTFGYGLSYTKFRYTQMEVLPSTIMPCEKVRVSVLVTNVGSVAGTEVVQLYLKVLLNTTLYIYISHTSSTRSWQPPMPIKQNTNTTVAVPLLQLSGFERIGPLAPQQSTKVEFIIYPKDMAAVVDYDLTWQIEPVEDYVVYVAGAVPSQQNSGRGIPVLQSSFTIGGRLRVPLQRCN